MLYVLKHNDAHFYLSFLVFPLNSWIDMMAPALPCRQTLSPTVQTDMM